MEASIIERVKSAENLPSLPTVAVEVLRLTKDENASANDLAEVLQNDPAMTAKLLKVVNSSMFGLSREITSVKQAMNLLGWRTVRIMVLSFSLVEMMSSDEGGFDYESYWRQSLTTAVTARLIGKAAKSRCAEEAFVAGLLSNIGQLAAFQCAADVYQPVLEAARESEKPFFEIERELLGVTYAQLGASLLDGWGLPESLCQAIGAHLGDGLDSLENEADQIGHLVHAASALAGVFCRDVPPDQLDAAKASCMKETNVTQEALEEVLEGLDDAVRETASLLSIHVGQTCNYAQIQMEAMQHLTQLSMQAEVERQTSQTKANEALQEADRLQQENQVIRKKATTDALTKLPNRAAFDEKLEEALANAKKTSDRVGLIMMDVDHFKKFNDTYGHQAGDEVLRVVGATIATITKGVAFPARYGGEEFAVILSGEAADSISLTAEHLRRHIEEKRIEFNGETFSVTASFGAARLQAPAETLTVEQVIEQADQMLYKAKENGRNRLELAA